MFCIHTLEYSIYTAPYYKKITPFYCSTVLYRYYILVLLKHACITKSKSIQGGPKVPESGSVIRLQPWKGLAMFGQDLAMNN